MGVKFYHEVGGMPRTDVILGDSEPIRRSFSEAELRDAALAWMRKNRAEGYEPNTDRYHEKLGLLVDFVTDLMQNGKLTGSDQR